MGIFSVLAENHIGADCGLIFYPFLVAGEFAACSIVVVVERWHSIDYTIIAIYAAHYILPNIIYRYIYNRLVLLIIDGALAPHQGDCHTKSHSHR